MRWSFRAVLWSVRCALLGGGINGGWWGNGVGVAETLQNGGVLWCCDVDVVWSWL